MIRIGIAGLGFMGMVHYLTYQKLRGARVVAVCEQNRSRLTGDWRDIRGNFGPAGRRMDLTGVRTYASLDDLLADDGVDLVDVTLPPALHAGVTVKALAAEKHVFCEKPMALVPAACRRMTRAADEAGKQLLIGHVLPFFPEYSWALRTIRSGKFGSLRGGSFKRVISDPEWLPNFWQADQVGGPMLDLAVHDAHFIRLVFGMPSRVTTRGSLRNGLAEHWHSLFDFPDAGVVVQSTSGVINQQGRSFNHGFEIHLQRATLAFEFAVIGGVGRYLCEPMVLDARGKARVIKLRGGDPLDAFRAELGEVVSCVAHNRPSEILHSDLARDAITLCDKQTASLTAGRPVRI
jgi:predicted dehydrogenase